MLPKIAMFIAGEFVVRKKQLIVDLRKISVFFM